MRFRNSSYYFGLPTHAHHHDDAERRCWQGFPRHEEVTLELNGNVTSGLSGPDRDSRLGCLP
jgi:hypothetical protein